MSDLRYIAVLAVAAVAIVATVAFAVDQDNKVGRQGNIPAAAVISKSLVDSSTINFTIAISSPTSTEFLWATLSIDSGGYSDPVHLDGTGDQQIFWGSFGPFTFEHDDADGDGRLGHGEVISLKCESSLPPGEYALSLIFEGGNMLFQSSIIVP